MTCPHCNDEGIVDTGDHYVEGFAPEARMGWCDCDVGEAMRDADWEMNAPGRRGDGGNRGSLPKSV